MPPDQEALHHLGYSFNQLKIINLIKFMVAFIDYPSMRRSGRTELFRCGLGMVEITNLEYYVGFLHRSTMVDLNNFLDGITLV